MFRSITCQIFEIFELFNEFFFVNVLWMIDFEEERQGIFEILILIINVFPLWAELIEVIEEVRKIFLQWALNAIIAFYFFWSKVSRDKTFEI